MERKKDNKKRITTHESSHPCMVGYLSFFGIAPCHQVLQSRLPPKNIDVRYYFGVVPTLYLC